MIQKLSRLAEKRYNPPGNLEFFHEIILVKLKLNFRIASIYSSAVLTRETCDFFIFSGYKNEYFKVRQV